jgi:glutathione S-transferase
MHLDLFDFGQWQPWYLALNPKGVVPVLAHDGLIITDSNIICEYLEETFTDVPLSPRDPKLRSQMRKWMLHSEEDLHSAIATASFNKLASWCELLARRCRDGTVHQPYRRARSTRTDRVVRATRDSRLVDADADAAGLSDGDGIRESRQVGSTRSVPAKKTISRNQCVEP